MNKPIINLASLEWRLLQNGAINIYSNKNIIKSHYEQLEKEGYQIEILRCDTKETFEHDITMTLNWKEQFGYSPWNGNLNALNDAMREMNISKNGKLVLVCENFHKLVKIDSNCAIAFLDLLEYNSRNHLLVGCRTIGLIHTEDTHFHAYPLGAR